MHLPPLLLPDVRFGDKGRTKKKNKKNKKNLSTARPASTETESQGGLGEKKGKNLPSISWQAWLTQVQNRVLAEKNAGAKGKNSKPSPSSAERRNWKETLAQLQLTQSEQPTNGKAPAVTDLVSTSSVKISDGKAATPGSEGTPKASTVIKRPPEDQLRSAKWYDIIQPGTVLYKRELTDNNDPDAIRIVQRTKGSTVILPVNKLNHEEGYIHYYHVVTTTPENSRPVEHAYPFAGRYANDMASPDWLVEKEAGGSKESKRDLGYA